MQNMTACKKRMHNMLFCMRKSYIKGGFGKGFLAWNEHRRKIISLHQCIYKRQNLPKKNQFLEILQEQIVNETKSTYVQTIDEFKQCVVEKNLNLSLKAIFVGSAIENDRTKLYMLPLEAVDDDFEDVSQAFNTLLSTAKFTVLAHVFTATVWDAVNDINLTPGTAYHFLKVRSPSIYRDCCQFIAQKNEITQY
jgi:hypothetical protein